MEKTMLLGQGGCPGEFNVYSTWRHQSQRRAKRLHGPLPRKAVAHAVSKVNATRLKGGHAHCSLLIYVYVNVNYGSILLFYLGQ